MPIVGTPISQTPTGDTYVTIAGVSALVDVATLPGWSAANDTQRAAALLAATLDVDASGRFQGRKYDAAQELEFPRQADELTVWDLDDDEAAVVPRKVKLATIYQAESLLADPARQGRLQAIADGVVSQGIGSANESYRSVITTSALCARSMALLAAYRLRGGRVA